MYVILGDLVRPLQLVLGLEESGGVFQQHLGVLGLDGGGIVLVLEIAQVPPQLLVLDALGIDLGAAAVLALGLLRSSSSYPLVFGDEFGPGAFEEERAVIVGGIARVVATRGDHLSVYLH